MYLNQAKEHLVTLLKETIPVFLWGAPGCGKSSIVKQICEEKKWQIVDLRLSLLNPVDLRGLPYMNEGKDTAIWLRPEFLPIEGDGWNEYGILFLDELNTAPTSVQIAAYQLLLDRHIGNYNFPKKWRMIAAGNRECLTGNTWIKTPKDSKKRGNLRFGWKTIAHLKMGDKVISYNFKKAIFEEDIVLKKLKRKKQLSEKLYKVITNKNNYLEITGKHLILTKRGYVQADSLYKGDVILEFPETSIKYKQGIIFPHIINNKCLLCGKEILSPNKVISCSYSCSAKMVKNYGGNRGYHHKQDAKMKISKASIRMWQDPEKRKQLIKLQTGVPKPDGFSEKMSQALKLSKKHQERMKKYYPEALMNWRKNNPDAFLASSQKGSVSTRRKIAGIYETKPEARMRSLLEKSGISFSIEEPIYGEDKKLITIADFYIKEKRMTLFADGNYWHNYPYGTKKDKVINKKLKSLGYLVFRKWETELNDLESVRKEFIQRYTNGATVISVEEIHSRCYVYDITTRNHNYIANGLIVHNSDKAAVTRMPSPLANRLIHLEVEANIDDWKKWAAGKIDERIIAFLNYRPALLSTLPKDEVKAYPTPRSWDFVSRTLKLYSDYDQAEKIVDGTVGEGASKEFFAFLGIYKDLPDVDKILEGKEHNVPKKTDVLYALVGALTVKLKDSNLDNFMIYVMKMQPEFSTLAVRDAARSGWHEKIQQSKYWNKWANKFSGYLD